MGFGVVRSHLVVSYVAIPFSRQINHPGVVVIVREEDAVRRVDGLSFQGLAEVGLRPNAKFTIAVPETPRCTNDFIETFQIFCLAFIRTVE